MKKRLLGLFIMFCTLPFLKVNAQEFLPFAVSPYSGVTASQFNPAAIAGSKYKFDVTVFGGSAGVHNDLLIFSRKKQIFNVNVYGDLWDAKKDFWDANVSQDTRNNLKHHLSRSGTNWGEGDYGGYLAAQMDILHLMYKVNDRFSLAAGYSLKAYSKMDNIAEGVARSGMNRVMTNMPINTGSIDNSAFNLALYHQVNLTGAYTLLNQETNKLKVGATLKGIIGGKSAFTYADKMSVSPTGAVLTNGEYGKSKSGNFGFGFDVGAQYEYQPAELKGNEVAEYRFLAGVSLLDVGSYKSKDAEYYKLDNNINSFPTSFQALRSHRGASLGDSYTTKLPTMISGQFDYNFGSGFFLNFTPMIALNQGNAHAISKFNSYNLVPHFELKNFGVSVPIQLDGYGKFTAGLGLRAWRHVWVGSNTIIKNLNPIGDNKNYSADIHVMVKIPISGGSNDRDGDGVPDKIDRCPDTPGLKKFQGCPDTDGDGIPDIDDKCPNEPGPASTQGCPDRDNDGIADKDDRCPDQAGPAEFQGCPDRDGDGVPDIDDLCPDQPGPKATKGCPDRDGDGVADKDDRCPDQPGPAALQGCPDRDGDGIPDIDDKCPDVPGLKEYDGCPAPDATTVHFDIDKFNIKPEFQDALNKIADQMSKETNIVVHIVGHTDNTFTRQYNYNLSKKRAESVKNYLVKRNADAKRITTEYFGPDKPIADNNTKDGRSKNRRAEITIVIK